MKPIYEFARFRLDQTNKTLFHNGTQVPLTPKAFDTLTLLVEHSGQLIQKDEFMRQLWPETFVEDAVLADNISRLRRALGDHNGLRLIATVPKRGYRFVGDVSREAHFAWNRKVSAERLARPHVCQHWDAASGRGPLLLFPPSRSVARKGAGRDDSIPGGVAP